MRPASIFLIIQLSNSRANDYLTHTYFKFNLTILTTFANIIIEIGTTDKRLVQIHISYEK